MNVNITINGDIHIHCDCCGDCGDFFENDFEEAIKTSDKDADEITDLSPEEAESVLKAVAELIISLLREDVEE